MPTSRYWPRSAYSTRPAVGRQGAVISLSSTQPCPSTQRRMIFAGTPAIDAAIRKRATHHGTGGHDDVFPDLGAGQDDHVGPQPAPRSDAHPRLGGPLPPDGLDRVRHSCGSGR